MPRTDVDQVFVNGVAVTSVERIVDDAQIEREDARTRAQIEAALNRLAAIATQGDTIAAQGSNVTQAQLKQLFGATADIARIVRRLILATVG